MNINAGRCIEYLRGIGISISDADAAAWLERESAYRSQRRAHNRELKRSCGHFATHETTVYWEGRACVQTICNNCRRVVSDHPIGSPPPRARKRKVA